MFKNVELGELISPAKTIRCGDSSYPVLSMTMHNGLMYQNEKFNKVIASKDTSDYKVVYRNQLVISFPIDEGVLATQRITDAGIVSPAYGIWDIDKKLVLPEYLEYALRSNRAIQYYKAKLRGSTARRRSLPTPTLLSFQIQLPSLEEQYGILDKVHRVKEIVRLREAQLKKLDILTKSRFIEMFGDPVIDTKHWGQKPLKEMLESIRYGTSTPPKFSDEGYAFIRATNIKNGKIVSSDMKFISQIEADRLEKCKLSGGEIIIVRSGVNAGDTCVVTSQYVGQYAGYDIILVLNEFLNPVFLNTLINTAYMEKVVKPMTRRAAQPHLNSEQTQSFPIICVPRDLQDQFAAFVREVDKSRDAIQKSLDETQLLFDSLMQEYFG